MTASRVNPPASAPVSVGWYLRIDDGSTFGPVAEPDLVEWAEQGRIAPGNQLSQDQQTWVDADMIPALGMDWLVELADGTVFGPVNIRALSDLMQDGTVDLDCALENRRTGESTIVARHQADILGENGAPLSPIDAERQAELAQRVATLEAQSQAARDALEKARLSAREQAERHDVYRKQTDKDAGTLRQRVHELEDKSRTLVDQLKLAEKKLEESKAAQAKREIDWIEADKSADSKRQALSQRETELDEAVQKLTREAREAQQLAQEAREELQGQAAAVDALKKESQAREAELQREIEQLRQQSTETATALEEARNAHAILIAAEPDPALTNRIAELEQLAREQGERLDIADMELAALQAELSELQQAAEARERSANEEHTALRERAEAITAELENARAEIEALQDRHGQAAGESLQRETELRAQLQAAEQTAEAAHRELETAWTQIQERTNDYQALRDHADGTEQT
ncbi:MAG: hypothetical protein O3B24_06110, partial [Verrucomicrobia bacterium]|nr:hypothetical protein [Verrucomicrobiota bacterium]